MGVTLNDFEAKALQVLLSQRFLSLPLFEEEELSEYHIADNQGEMNLEDFIRQYAEVITEQFKADYENRLKADLEAILTDLYMEIEELDTPSDDSYDAGIVDCEKLIQEKINNLQVNNSKVKEQDDAEV